MNVERNCRIRIKDLHFPTSKITTLLIILPALLFLTTLSWLLLFTASFIIHYNISDYYRFRYVKLNWFISRFQTPYVYGELVVEMTFT